MWLRVVSVGAIAVMLKLPGGSTEWINASGEESGGTSSEESLGMTNPAAPSLNHRCFSGGPVNCATGNQVETQTDLSVGGRGPGLTATRTYNSQLAVKQSEAKQHGSFGYGWSGPYSAHLTETCGPEKLYCTATVYQNDASAVSFTKAGEQWASAPWVQATLFSSGGSYVYTLPSQTKLIFNESGRLLSETDRNSNTITMAYNAENQLVTATDGDSRKLTFKYNVGRAGRKRQRPDGPPAKYTYESGNLASVTLPGEASARWKFEYNASNTS